MRKISKKVEIVTDWIGYTMVVMSFLIIVAPIFIEVKRDYTQQWGVPISLFIGGIGFIALKENVLNAIGKWFDKKSDSL